MTTLSDSTGLLNETEEETENGAFDEMEIIRRMNNDKAVLLIPAITYTVILMVIGVIGNPLAIYIYGFRWEKTTLKYFLLSLAIIDLVNCVITMPTEIAMLRNFYYFSNAKICKMSRFTTYVMNNASSAIFLVIAVDRYIKICKPYTKPMSVRASKVACCVALFAGVSVSWPAVVMYDRIDVPIRTNVTGAVCGVHPQEHYKPYLLAFFIYLWVAFSLIGVVISVLYILIYRAILTRKKSKLRLSGRSEDALKRIRSETSSHNDAGSTATPKDGPETWKIRSYTSNDDAEHQMPADYSLSKFSNGSRRNTSKTKWDSLRFRPGRSTVMLFAITVVYVLTFLPFLIVTIIRTHVGASFYSSLTKGEEVAVNIFLRSYLVNNCANPIVYGFCNVQFRQECKQLFKRVCCRKQDNP
ncbi:G-protein coupled receptor 84-like [Gigantopelta aegis]|uniref:G-protein coupled receptor 84-like n=1 Tax=Gigantopelta aegis TaxID=1735272 RepID=UPI001B889333|nr:G-protein coupled receptor 84-like [Gigantopelta aegis]XP_041361202.1 G-protein coupled receptor 84-like [Gigantopelta aegis]